MATCNLRHTPRLTLHCSVSQRSLHNAPILHYIAHLACQDNYWSASSSGPKSGQLWSPVLAEFGQFRVRFGRSRAKFGQPRPIFDDSGPDFESGQVLAQFSRNPEHVGQFRAMFGRRRISFVNRPIPGQSWPNLADFGETNAEFGPRLADSDLGRIWPGQNSAIPSRIWHTLAELGRARLIQAHFGPSLRSAAALVPER